MSNQVVFLIIMACLTGVLGIIAYLNHQGHKRDRKK